MKYLQYPSTANVVKMIEIQASIIYILLCVRGAKKGAGGRKCGKGEGR